MNLLRDPSYREPTPSRAQRNRLPATSTSVGWIAEEDSAMERKRRDYSLLMGTWERMHPGSTIDELAAASRRIASEVGL